MNFVVSTFTSQQQGRVFKGEVRYFALRAPFLGCLWWNRVVKTKIVMIAHFLRIWLSPACLNTAAYGHVWTCPKTTLNVHFQSHETHRVVSGVRWCSDIKIVANCGFHPCFHCSSRLWNYFISCLTPMCKLPLDCSFDPEALYTLAHLMTIMLLYVGVANRQETIAM